MANLYGNQYNNAYVTVPSVKIAPGDFGGMKRIMYFDYTITAASTNADIIKLGKLPKGARLINASFSGPALAGTTSFSLGWAASAELVGVAGSAAVVAADATGILTAFSLDAVDANSMQQQMEAAGTNTGYLKEFAAEVDVQLAVIDAWSSTSGTLKGYLEYVVI